MEPRTLPHAHPLAETVQRMCRAQCRGCIRGMRRVEEGRVLDGGEDVKVGEGADDAEENDSLNRRVGGVQREGAEKGAHGRCCTEESRTEQKQYLVRSHSLFYPTHLSYPEPPDTLAIFNLTATQTLRRRRHHAIRNAQIASPCANPIARSFLGEMEYLQLQRLPRSSRCTLDWMVRPHRYTPVLGSRCEAWPIGGRLSRPNYDACAHLYLTYL
ncbi:hypothetical protein GALMADRAFT_754079 [Galerina marginata CBS 339.88]|uniref:Uncharacterized protein n=1 Tax=Galerina marginata (strain CBS 339.88) TaxID=685588 RepID=A0A067SY11_GALM3|nr:hypothetical protein GALMADRAFT_754079 [Galerina marginata CBS 339.88]